MNVTMVAESQGGLVKNGRKHNGGRIKEYPWSFEMFRVDRQDL